MANMYLESQFENPIAKTCTRESDIELAKAFVQTHKVKHKLDVAPTSDNIISPKYQSGEEVHYCTSEEMEKWIVHGKYTKSNSGTIIDYIPVLGMYFILNRDETDPILIDANRVIKKV